MKNWNNQDVSNWLVGTSTIAKAMLPDFAVVSAAESDSLLQQLRTDFVGFSSLSEREVSVEEAEREFQLWLLSTHVKQHMSNTEQLGVTIERNFGQEKVTFTISSAFEITSGGSRSASFDKLIDIVNQEFYRYARDRAPKTRPENETGKDEVSKGTETLECTRFVVDIKDGKKYYKVKCGKYQEHGVNFWPEDIKLSGVDPKGIPDAGYDLSGWRAVVRMNGDKPLKVLRLIRPDAG